MKINYSVTATFKGLLRDISMGEQRGGEPLGAGGHPPHPPCVPATPLPSPWDGDNAPGAAGRRAPGHTGSGRFTCPPARPELFFNRIHLLEHKS